MNRNFHRDGHPVCGYDSCPCRDVHFISRYRGESDYCIDGERVRVSDESGISSRATAEQVRKLSLFFLESYADYCKWHAQQRARHGDEWPSLSPFNRPFAVAVPA